MTSPLQGLVPGGLMLLLSFDFEGRSGNLNRGTRPTVSYVLRYLALCILIGVSAALAVIDVPGLV
jgi:hypothetical protein